MARWLLAAVVLVMTQSVGLRLADWSPWDTPPGYDKSYAYGVSADGSVVVGYGNSSTTGGDEAFRWTSAGGMVGLGHLSNGFQSRAASVNADGTVVVGDGGDGSAFRWTASGGMVGLGHLSGDASSSASLVSTDGTVVVGYSYGSSYGSNQVFRWTATGGMVGLGKLTGIGVNGVSADGSVVVGNAILRYFAITTLRPSAGRRPTGGS